MRRQSSPNRRRHARKDRGLKPLRRWAEFLEPRLMLAADAWISSQSGSWDVAGNWSTGKVPASTDDVTISQPGVTVTISDADAAHSLTSSDAIVVSSGSLTLSTASSTSGALTVDGGATLTSDGVLTLSGDTADNSGTLAVVGGLSFAGATLTNEASGTIDLQADVGIAAASGTNIVHNAGLLEKSAGSGTSTVAVDLDNTGTVRTISGTLSISGAVAQVSSGALTGGTWDVADKSTLDLPGAGNLSSNAGTVTLGGPNAVFSKFNSVTTNSGTIDLLGTAGFSAAGDFTNSGAFSVASGAFQLNGHQLDNQTGATLTLGNDNALAGIGALNNSGSFHLAGGSGTMTVGTFNNTGGTITVDSGKLAIGGFGTSTGGSFVVSAGAAVDLTGAGGQPVYTGTYTGSGGGQVQVNSGTLAIGSGGATFDFPKGMFQWTGGQISALSGQSATLTNTGFITINTTTGVTIDPATTLANQGEIDDTGTGALTLGGPLDNQVGGTVVLQNTGGLNGGGTFSNEGTLKKMTGSGAATVGAPFDLNGGTVEADSGKLVLGASQGAGTSTGGSFVVSLGAAVDLTGVGGQPAYTGTYTGSGGGQVQVNFNGVNGGLLLIGSGGATFDFPKGMFQWTGGQISALSGQSATLTNTGFITINTTSGVTIDAATTLANQGEIDNTGTGALTLGGPLDNQAGGTFVLQNTGGLNGGGGTFSNEGTLKMTGSGAATVGAPFDLNGGTVEADSGDLVLGASGGTSTGGSFVVSLGAAVDLTGVGGQPAYTGTYTGSGGGQVQVDFNAVNGGLLLIGSGGATFDFPKGMFQWTGGHISARSGQSATLTNTGFITINTTNGVTIDPATTLANQGEIDNTGTGALTLGGPLDNQAGGTFVLQNTGGLNGGGTFSNEGTLKMTGSGAATVGAPFDLNGGTVEADSGKLVLGASQGAGTSTGGSFVVSLGAAVDLTGVGGQPAYTGTYTGSGGGQVQVDFNAVNGGLLLIGSGGATFDFPKGMFQWTAGQISARSGQSATLTNTGFITINTTNGVTIDPATTLANQGEIDDTGTGALTVGGPLDNQVGGTFVLQNTGGLNGGGGDGTFSNEGTLKMTGSGAATVGAPFDLNGGTVEADSGNLVLGAGAGTSTGGTFDVAQGGSVDISVPLTFGSALTITGAYTGTGAGTVSFSGGTLDIGIGGATFNFPGGMFQWTGGAISSSLGDLTNLGTMNLAGSNEKLFDNDGTLDNKGTIIQTGLGNLGLHSDNTFATTLQIDPGAVYQIAGDSGIDNPSSGGQTALVNNGTIEKTAGSGTSTLLINGSIANTGTIEADSGTLALSGTLAQLSGTTLTAGAWNAMNGATLALPSGDTVATNQAAVTLSGAGAAITGLAPLAANSGALVLTNGATFSTTRDFANNGALSVGPDSTLAVNGALTQASGAALAISLAGTPASGHFGQVTASGAATLGGTLQLALSGGYSPSHGDAFQVLKFASSTASFADITGPQFHGGNLFQAQTNATNLTVTAATAVADLSVTSATLVTTSAQAEQPVTVNYQVTNLGQGTVATTWQDAIFVSTHSTLDFTAVLLGHVTHTGAVATNGNYSGTLTAPLPLLLPGSYHVFVEADSQGIVPDSNRANNTLAAARTFSVSVPTLPLSPAGGIPKGLNFTMAKGQELLFQVSVPAGDDVTIAAGAFGAANGDAVDGISTLVAYGAVPTSANSLANFVTSFYPFISSVTLDNAQAGTYFIALTDPYGTANDHFTLSAQELPLAVTSVSPAQALNLGPVTMTITGDQFTPSTTVSLVSLFVGGPTIPAGLVTFENSTTLVATFNLLNAAAQIYNIEVSDHGKTFTTQNNPYEPIDSLFGLTPPGVTLTVADGATGGFSPYYDTFNPAGWGVNASILTSVDAPSAVRTGRVNSLSVNYTSDAYIGSTVQAPLFFLSANNAEFQLPGQSGFTSGSIMLLGINDSGAAGILPGAARVPLESLVGGHGELSVTQFLGGAAPVPLESVVGSPALVIDPSIKLNFIATGPGPVNFQVNVADPEATIDWSSLKSSLEPPGMPSAAWDAIFANFTATVSGFTLGQNGGDTYGLLGSLQTVLDNDASYLAQIGEPTADVNALLDFQLQQAGDFGSIAQRYAPGIFGLGMRDPTMTAVNDAQGNVDIVSGGQVRPFTLQPDGTYLGAPGDDATLKLIDGAYQLRETNGTLEVFNASGSLNYIQDAGGNKLTYGYTGTQLTSLTNSATGDVTTLAYNSQGLVSQVTDPEGRVTSLQYDPAGHLLSVTTPQGTTSYTYVTNGTPQQLNAIATITNPDGSQVAFSYDAKGRLIGQSENGGADPLTFSYSVGAITMTDAMKDASTVFLNQGAQMADITDPLGNIFQGNFSTAQQPTSISAPGGLTLSFAYGSLGEPISVIDPLGKQTSATYNPTFGGLQSITDPAGNSLNYSYDPTNGNLRSVSYADGSSQQYASNALGQVVQFITRGGQTIGYAYNPNGTLRSETFSDGTQDTFGYDGHRNLISMTDATGMTTFQHDSADRLTKVSYPNGTFLSYKYNAQSQRIQMQDQTGFTVNYTYNPLGQLLKLTDGSGNLIVSYQYDPVGRVASESFGNNAATKYTYDGDNNVLSIDNLAADGSTQSSYVYTYNSQNLPVTMTTSTGKFTYGYDADGQLVSVETPSGQTMTYRYDAAGNRVAVVASGQTNSYTTNNLNEYTQVGNTTYQYDTNGDLISSTNSGGMTTYRYNVLGQLTSVVSPSGTTTYQCNALGQLYSEDVNGTVTDLLNDPTALNAVVGQFSTAGSALAQYAYGLGLVSQTTAGGSSNFYSFDANGSTTQLTGPTGSVLDSYSYLPFGEQLSATGSAPNPFTYVGQLGVTSSANGSGLYHMGYRWYDAGLGRFVQPDPTGIGGGDTNLYRYVNNSPVSNRDPAGLQGRDDSIISLTPGQVSGLVNLGLTLIGATGAAGGAWISTIAGAGTAAGAAEVSSAVIGTAFTTTTTIVPITTFATNAFGETLAWTAVSGTATVTTTTGTAIVGVTGAASETTLAGVASAAAGGTVTALAGAAVAGAGATLAGYEIGVHVIKPVVFPNGNLGDAIVKYFYSKPQDVLPDAAKKRLADGFKPSSHTHSTSSQANDPNLITGPAGFGSQAFVSGIASLPYRIDFENQPTATAAADTVTVTQQLDPNLDLSTFQLGNIGFGNTAVQVPAGLTSYNIRVTLPSTAPGAGPNGLLVDVSASLNVQTGLVTWTLTSLDPVTMDSPLSPAEGLLPPDDANGDGEGFVSYTILPKASAKTGTVVNAQASVVFDTNAPLSTAPISNTIDAVAPTSSVTVLPTDSPPNFTVSWSGQDDAGGSGIASFSVYVSDNNAPFTPLLTDTTATSTVFTGHPGHTYDFFSVATDNAGNIEANPLHAQTTTTVVTSLPASAVNALPSTSPLSFTVSWSASGLGGPGAPTFSVFVSDNGGPFTAFQTDTTATSATFTGQPGHSYGFYSVATDSVGNVQATPTAAQATTTVSVAHPTSSVNPLPAVSPLSFTVSWSASGLGGSGPPTFNVFVSDNGGPFTAFQTGVTATSATFTGKPGHSYGFYSVVTDSEGNVQATPTAAQATTALPADLNSLYVAAVYNDVLGRAPDAGGLAFWSQQIDKGGPIGSVAQAIAHSSEYYTTFVIDPDYLKLLGRAADSAGIQFWVQKMDGGLTDQELEAGFVASDEFFNKAGGTNSDWVDAVYQLLLGRAADQNGQSFWDARLAAGVTRGQVASQIANSQENNTNLINADYFHYLGRAADQGGLTFWLAEFAAGQTNEDVIAGFTGSAEYYKERTTGG